MTVRGSQPTGPTRPDALLQPVFATAQSAPGQPAIVCRDTTLTYGELAERIRAMASVLRTAQVPDSAVIGVPVGRDAQSLIGCLGVLWAGLTVFPFDKHQPSGRALDQQRAAGIWATLDENGLARAEPRLPAPPEGRAVATGDQDAYILGTSGTTSAPKLVVIPVRAIQRYARGLLSRLVRPQGVSSLLMQPVSVDLGYTSIVASLATGGTLHILGEDDARDPARSRLYVAAHGIDLVKIAPSHLRALQQGDMTAVMPRRYLILGGEPLPAAYARGLVLANPGCAVYNHYGPSETAVGVAMHQVAPASARGQDQATITLGSALRGIHLEVADGGELLIGGDSVWGGYLRNPRETATRFIPAAHAGAKPGSRVFRSGDVVGLDDVGQPYFVERLDTQVKVHGHRVDLIEVESALRSLAGVTDAAAAIAAGEHLVAVVRAGPAFDQDLAPARIGQTLPAHMVPRPIVVADELPRLASGKVDRRMVAEIAAGAQAPGVTGGPGPDLADGTTEHGPLTEQIRSILADALDASNLAVDADFFSSGGDSLLAMTVIWQIRIDVGIDVSLADLVEGRSAAGLARLHESRLP